MKNLVNIILVIVIVAFVGLLGSLIVHVFFPGAGSNAKVIEKTVAAPPTSKHKNIIQVVFTGLESKTSFFAGKAYHYDVTFSVVDAASQQKLQANSKDVQSALDTVFSAKKPEEVDTPEKRQKLKLPIFSQIMMQHPDIKIKDIAFTKFVYN